MELISVAPSAEPPSDISFSINGRGFSHRASPRRPKPFPLPDLSSPSRRQFLPSRPINHATDLFHPVNSPRTAQTERNDRNSLLLTIQTILEAISIAPFLI